MDWVSKIFNLKFKYDFLTLDSHLVFYLSRKPVSYYLHVIDRTKLEKYFQGLKTKGTVNGDGKNERTIELF